MKNSCFKKIGCAVGAVALSIAVGLCGCTNNRTYYNNETDAMVLSILEVDGVFNPFFSTSGTDGTIVGMTQIGMLGNDKDGGYTYGPDENVVVEDLQIIEYDERGNVIDRSNKENDKIETAKSKYYFVLKNNIVFSDGSPLTMKDVLFNLYVYLDNFYTGASTIYSTDIIGLQEYRTGEASESEQDAFMVQFENSASGRVDALLGAITAIKNAHKGDGSVNSSDALEDYLVEYKESATNQETYGNIVDDYKQAIKLFKEELESDWTNSLDSYADTTFKNANGEVIKPFTTDVEVFLYNENMITWNKKANAGAGELTSSLTNDLSELKSYTKQQAIDAVFDSQIPDHVDEVLQYWATATELHSYLVNAEMEKYFRDNPRTEYTNVSGIKFANKDEAVSVNGKQYAVPTYYGDGEQGAHPHNAKVKDGNEVLSIEINKVDPKAIWNFAFSVAPMYYYSNDEQIALTDYESHFGVESSQTFMQTVIGNEEKSGVPVGAGPYMAATSSDSTTNVTRGTFHANSMVYFVRNEKYIGGAPKIKKLRYSIVTASNVMTRLQSGDVDFAEPNAKQEIIEQLNGMKKDGYNYKQITTAGYGYIGINAAKVPDLEIRQAIMHAINTQECVNYYKTGASAIYRSMSLSNWAYPKDCQPYYPYIGSPVPDNWNTVNVNPAYRSFVASKHKKAGDTFTKEEQLEFLSKLVSDAGYTEGSGDAYVKGNNMLKYIFTIAGDETDHPAYSALLHASELLNEVGFEIDVKPDSQALKKLTTGSLAVWAAAWGSTIDPDMYQVYHKESNASSVKNWGYPQILLNAGNKYDRENVILEDLSLLIEQAREVNGQDNRAPIYAKALTKVMELAVELPTYQRDDLFAYKASKLDETTFTPDNLCSPYRGLMYDIHNVSLIVEK